MNLHNKSILVTGAAGLIGSAVIDELLCRDCRVMAVDIKSPPEYSLKNDNVDWVHLDIAESDHFSRVLDKSNLDGVIHTAAHPGGLSLKEPTKDVEVNALGSMRVFEYCAHRQLPVVYTSSSIIYGEQPHFPTPETASLNPGTIYGACKVACEKYLHILGEGYGLPWTVVRLFATYGAGHTPSSFQGIVNVMLSQLLDGDRVVVKGSLQRIRDMLYVDDAARGLVDALFCEKARGQIINMGTGDPVTIQKMIETLARVMGKQIGDIELVEEEGTVGDVFYNSADCTLANELFDYKPQYNLEQGLMELLSRRRQTRVE